MAVHTFFNPRSGTMRSGYWRRFASRNSSLLGEVMAVDRLADVKASDTGPGDTVIAAGGDGTLRSVAEHFGAGTRPAAEMPTVLLLPAGTSNSVARSLGIPIAGASWPGYLRRHRRVCVDAGSAGGRLFVLCASAGLSGAAVGVAERERKSGTSSWSYARAVLRALSGGYRITAEADGAARKVEGAEIILANMYRFAGAVRIGKVDPCDGFLSMAVMGGPLGFAFRCAVSAFHGPPVPSVPVRSVLIRGEGEFQVDGEPGGPLPVEVRVLPRAVPMGLPG